MRPQRAPSGCDVIASLPKIQLKLQADDAGVGLDIAETEVGIVTVFDLGNPALTASELGGHLRLGESCSHPGDDELIDEPGLGRELLDSLGHPTIAMSAEHLIDATIGAPSCGWAAGDGLR